MDTKQTKISKATFSVKQIIVLNFPLFIWNCISERLCVEYYACAEKYGRWFFFYKY